jgi:hypothetical protein
VDDPSTTGKGTEPSPARIEVDPMHVVVSGTYADSSVDVGSVHPPAPVDRMEMIGRAREALQSAERAFSRFGATGRV